MAATRKTQRIPRSQRKRRGRELTLGPETEAILAALPKGEASAYVERAILELANRDSRMARTWSTRTK